MVQPSPIRYPGYHADGTPFDDRRVPFNRAFDPAFSTVYQISSERNLRFYDPETQLTHLQARLFVRGVGWTREVHRETLVVHISHDWRYTDVHGTIRAAWAVSFGRGSQYNLSNVLPTSMEQSSARAMIEALGFGLSAVSEMPLSEWGIRMVVLMCDSIDLVRTMTEWIDGWIERGGRRSNGAQVPSFAALTEIDHGWTAMEDELGIDIRLRYITSDRILDAEELATDTLDSFVREEAVGAPSG
jgi:ribonuclease HI